MESLHETAAILGAGGWGVALASSLHRNGRRVVLWEFDSAAAEELRATRTLAKKLPGITLPEGVGVTDSLAEALDGASVAVLVTPTRFVRSTCQAITRQALGGNRIWACGSKGIEQKTLLRMSEVIFESLEGAGPDTFVALSGPSHAEEVARQLPTTLAAVSANAEAAAHVRDLFLSETLRVYTGEDVIGVELGASLKNVIALAAGISDGLGFGDNAKAALVTRGLAEITRLGVAVGAKPYTFSGLAGLGDLVVTCCSRHSRNWQLGNRLAKGQPADEAMNEMGMEVEGYHTAASVVALSEKHRVEMPIACEVHHILYKGKAPKEAVRDLMLRDTKDEIEAGLWGNGPYRAV